MSYADFPVQVAVQAKSASRLELFQGSFEEDKTSKEGAGLSGNQNIVVKKKTKHSKQLQHILNKLVFNYIGKI